MMVSFCSSSFLLKPFSTTEMEKEAGWGRQREGVCSPQLSGEDRIAFSCDSCALSSERCQFPERHLEMRQDLTQYSEDTLTHSWENTFLEVPRCTPADAQRHAQDWRLTSPTLVLWPAQAGAAYLCGIASKGSTACMLNGVSRGACTVPSL